jgi:hypothetical protein
MGFSALCRMSSPIRVAVVAEGPTDAIVIQSALQTIFEDRSFVLTQLQPEGSIAFGEFGGGWAGVYRWCKQSRQRGHGRVSNDELVFSSYDLLVVHVDAEIAAEDYGNAGITREDKDKDFPGLQPCPPASATSDSVRKLLLDWCGETAPTVKVVLCVPCMNMETWVVACLFPDDAAVMGPPPWECHQNPGSRLAQQPVKFRIRKSQADYRNMSAGLTERWPSIASANGLSQAKRFDDEVVSAYQHFNA